MTLASTMGDAERALRLAEVKIEALLTTLFQDWKGWAFWRGDGNRFGIDVYCVTSSSIAIRSLFAAGFTTTVLHHHPASRFLTCQCVVHEAY